MSVQNKYKILEVLYPDLLRDIGALIQKGKLSKRFNNINLTDEEVIRLNKAKELCELKIVEYWDEEIMKLSKFCALLILILPNYFLLI